MVLKKLNARSWIYIVGGLFLIIIIALLAYLVFKEKYSAADVPAEPYKCEKECIVLTTTGQDADNRINPLRPWKVTLKNNSQYTLSIETSPFDIVDYITGKSVYSQPAPTRAITVNEGGNTSWSITKRDISFDNVTIPWSRYKIVLNEDIQDPSIYAPSPTIDLYGSYENLTTDENGNPFVDDSGVNGDMAMFKFGLAINDAIADLGEGDYDAGMEEIFNETNATEKTTLKTNTQIPDGIWQKILANIASKAYAADDCTAFQVDNVVSLWTNSVSSGSPGKICLEKYIFKGKFTGEIGTRMIHIRSVSQPEFNSDKILKIINFRFIGTMETYEYIRAINRPNPQASGVDCKKEITTVNVNKSGEIDDRWSSGLYVMLKEAQSYSSLPSDVTVDQEPFIKVCSFTSPINITAHNRSFDRNKCCRL